jgi:plasmid maintenance system antidote protein VapI
MDTISHTLRSAIQESGYSIRRLSILTGINRETITRFLRGDNITIHNADKLAALMGLELKPGATAQRKNKGI